MPSCKDCLSCKVCYHTQVEGWPECTEVRDCEHFKDRNRFIELPFKIGDMFYFIKNTPGIPSSLEPQPKKIIMIAINDKHTSFYTESRMFRYCDIGKTVFLTRKESEQALKESEYKND